MISSGLKALSPVMALAMVLPSSADTVNQSSSKVMVRGCKAMIDQNQIPGVLIAHDNGIDVTEQFCLTQEEIGLLEAATTQHEKEWQWQDTW